MGYGNVSPKVESNLHISPKMSDSRFECDTVAQLHAYDFVIEDLV